MPDILSEYKQGRRPLPVVNKLWPLYGAGLENLGRNGQLIEVPMPDYGPDELLVRHDACGLCFSDIKVIKLGEKHPRIFRDIRREPIVLGHEVSMTVVGVGEHLRDQYRVGDRFIIQADIVYQGVGYAYGYMLQGGLSQYGVIDQRVLNGDDGNYLIPVQPDTGYAESALTEPWACVIAAYRLEYRTGLKPGGVTWIIGSDHSRTSYTMSAGFEAAVRPAQLLLTNVPADLAGWLRREAAQLGIPVHEASDPSRPPVTPVDDLILLDPSPEVIEAASPHLAEFGVAAILADAPLPRRVDIDMGRIHYNRWVYVGSQSTDITRAYRDVPVRAHLKPGGRAWFVGAGGPMGRMHVQRAVQLPKGEGPSVIVNSDVSDLRLSELCTSFAAEAEAKGIQWVCLNPTDKETYAQVLTDFQAQGGFDDIMMLVPVPAVIAEAAAYLAPRGVMNVFAGVGRGTMVNLDLSDVYMKDVRYIGHSASRIEDMREMLFQVETGKLSTNRSVAAVGSLEAVRDGLQAVIDTAYPGKIVIFPHIRPMPLTALPDLKHSLPTVYARLHAGREWTKEAEEEFLRLMLV